MPRAPHGVILDGQHGTTTHGAFWRWKSGAMALYSRQYPRGCVIMDAEGVIAAIGELRGSVALEAIVRAHYTAAQEAIAAGQVREFIASEADAAKTGMLKTDASQRPARAGSLR